METGKRFIDAKPLAEDGWHLVKTGKSNVFIASMSLADIPTVDAVEVVRITEVKQKILKVMDEFIADWLGITQSYTDIFRAKIDAMETAKRLVNAALTDLCDNCGAKMDGGNEDGNL